MHILVILVLIVSQSALFPCLQCGVNYKKSTSRLNLTLSINFEPASLYNKTTVEPEPFAPVQATKPTYKLSLCPRCIQQPCIFDMKIVEDYKKQIADIERRLSHLEAGGIVFGDCWYWFSSYTMNWDAAKGECESKGARLATVGVRDNNIRYHLEGIIKDRGGGFYWIGLSDRWNESTWKWSDGIFSTGSNTSWRKGEPNNHGVKGEDCGALETGLIDHSCGTMFRAICEKDIV
uniref:C-type lectin domain family 4 member E-like n=1 Tax=Styela clava TaxID=7725 RepID=UPI001939CF03|nr:C-type lectin domain family 4 member E-like [Styela clava]